MKASDFNGYLFLLVVTVLFSFPIKMDDLYLNTVLLPNSRYAPTQQMNPPDKPDWYRTQYYMTFVYVTQQLKP